MILKKFLQVFLNILGFSDKNVTSDSDGGLESRIMFGSEASIQNYPFFAGITVNGQHTCGAAIISDRWLLTAAHCISPRNVYIAGGDSTRNSFQLVPDKIVIHRNYKNGNGIIDNDIALVRLAARLTFTDKVQPVKLPGRTEMEGPLLALGRGLNEYGGNSPILMKVDLVEVNTTQCHIEQKRRNHFICTTRSPGPSTNVCFGDSGSPLISYSESNATLVGITSFITNRNCHQNTYSAFVKVAHYVPWIRWIMKMFPV